MEGGENQQNRSSEAQNKLEPEYPECSYDTQNEMSLDFQVGSRKRERPKVALEPRRKKGVTKHSGRKGKAGKRSQGQKRKEKGSLSSTGSSERESREEIEKWYRVITENAKTDPPNTVITRITMLGSKNCTIGHRGIITFADQRR